MFTRTGASPMSEHHSSPSRRELRTVLVGAAAAAALPHPGGAQTNGITEKYDATAINMGSGPNGMGRVEIAVNRWSTGAERKRLLKVLVEEGPEKLLDAV